MWSEGDGSSQIYLQADCAMLIIQGHGSLLYQICRELNFRVRLRLCASYGAKLDPSLTFCRINNPSLVSQNKQWLFKLLKLTCFNLTKKQKADITIIMKAQLYNNPEGFSLMFDLWLQSSSSTQPMSTGSAHFYHTSHPSSAREVQHSGKCKRSWKL